MKMCSELFLVQLKIFCTFLFNGFYSKLLTLTSITMSIEKKYSNSSGVCKVTFNLPSTVAEQAKTANLVGDFNNWDSSQHPMKKSKNGKFSLSVELEVNNVYEFRYLVNESRWETDWDADSVVPVPFGNEFNSVVKL
jgi:1,4-alpha-glucan branching enzyme